jgi:transcriptional regulator with XRE-family HTH domain|nr:helix-turn-helix transcriptional regulator [Neorhizobium tomejilense]
MTTKTDEYIASAGLVETRDPESGDSLYRSVGFDGVPSMDDLDVKIGEALRASRERRDLTRPDLAPMLGLTPQVYGRYERGEAKLSVTRLVHLAEILDFSPLDVISAAAPHVMGRTIEEADIRCRLIAVMEKLPLEKAKLLLDVAETFLATQPARSLEK